MAEKKLTMGTSCWAELHSQNVATSSELYKNLFGWNLEIPAEMNEKYAFFTLHGQPIAGLIRSNIHPEKQPFWVNYFVVDDVVATVQHAQSLKAIIHLEPTETQGNRVAIIEDATGVIMGLFEQLF